MSIKAPSASSLPDLERDSVARLQRELSDMAQRIAVLEQSLKQVATAEPSKYREGDFAFADGTTWNPGAGRGLYQRVSSSWTALHLDPIFSVVSGKVGINLASPAYTLDVGGTVNVTSASGALSALQSAGGTGFRWRLNNDGTFRLERTTNGFGAVTTPMYVGTDGVLGFNLTSPLAFAHFRDTRNSGTPTVMRVESYQSTVNPLAILHLGSGPGASASTDFILCQDDIDGTPTDRFKLISNGWLQIFNAAAPGSNPTGSGYLYAEAGAGKWRGSGGTITTFGPAEPHCPECGRDFALEWVSEKYGKLAICMWCATEGLTKGIIKREAV